VTEVRRAALRQTCGESRQIMGRVEASHGSAMLGIHRHCPCPGFAGNPKPRLTSAGRDPRSPACDRGHARLATGLGAVQKLLLLIDGKSSYFFMTRKRWQSRKLGFQRVDLVTARMPRAEIAKRMGISEMRLRRFEKRLLSAREAIAAAPAPPRAPRARGSWLDRLFGDS
jgi:hypothetical protein